MSAVDCRLASRSHGVSARRRRLTAAAPEVEHPNEVRLRRGIPPLEVRILEMFFHDTDRKLGSGKQSELVCEKFRMSTELTLTAS